MGFIPDTEIVGPRTISQRLTLLTGIADFLSRFLKSSAVKLSGAPDNVSVFSHGSFVDIVSLHIPETQVETTASLSSQNLLPNTRSASPCSQALHCAERLL